MNILYLIMGLVLLVVILLPLKLFPSTPVPWVVYYENQAPLKDFDAFNLIILDSESAPYLSALHESGKLVLGYLSLGEVANSRSYFNAVKEQQILLDENPNWPGSYYVDVRNPLWKKRVIEELIPPILFNRFDGLFLDTLDNPTHLERTDPVKYKGMYEATVDLVRTIRRHYPQIKIMMNRGYDVLGDVAHYLDYVLGESVFSSYDFKTKEYKKQSEENYSFQVNLLQETAKKHPSLQIMSLDYWDPKDLTMIKEIYAIERKNGFNPYVSTIELNTIIPEPQ